MKKIRNPFGERLAEAPTVAKRYRMPRYVMEQLRRESPPYGSQGRAIQVGAELLSRMRYHPIPPNPALTKGISGAMDQVGMTYKLLPRTIEIIDRYTEQYGTKGHVFEAIVTLLKRDFIV